MKKLIAMLLMLLLALPAQAQVTVTPVEAADPKPIALDQLDAARERIWKECSEAWLEDPILTEELGKSAMTFGEATMRFSVQICGDMPEGGYPLYIAMHGGGSDDTPDLNDEQWAIMKDYYSDALECGVYVAVRGVRDTWDTHFNPESYPLYDRLIKYMILNEDINPNRVYLEGFSAGGDGVYAISCRMPDRFAGANMSSGHPNGISLVNLYNLPMQLQAGEFDEMYDRNIVTAEYGLKLDELQAKNPGGYEHRTLIHYDAGHNYEDSAPQPIPVMKDVAAWLNEKDRTHVDVDCYPPHYMDQFTRNPLPDTVVWDLTTRADSRETEAYYYLSAPYSVNQGTIRVKNEGDNRFTVEAKDVNGEFSMLLNERMVDFSKPVTFVVNGEESSLTLTPDEGILTRTTADRADPNFQFEAEVVVRGVE